MAPVPEWAQLVAPDEQAQAPSSQVSRGAHYLLYDEQVRVLPQGREVYRHIAARALNEKGVETLANVEVSFDPAFQSLTLHSIQLRREGRVISRLGSAEVRVLQREKELEYRIFDGTKTAHVFLEDVRVGDVVEYAYTVRGRNPVFADKLFGRLDLQWNVPVHHVHARLLMPLGRRVEIAPLNTRATPEVREHDGYRDYTWNVTDVPALVVDEDAPAWFDPYASVQWSEYAGWKEVANWASPLYTLPDRLGPDLQAQVRRIAAETQSPRKRLQAVLALVQREVRYLGVEVGPGSHAPNPPDLVFSRRFGDCKDKSLLTVAMLHALGVEAYPALVHTALRGSIEGLQPSPGVFNHVIVRARVGGLDYWLDPTRPPQKGDLDALYQPAFGKALVIEPSAAGLTAIPRMPGSALRRTIRAVLDARAGIDQPVRYTVTTVAEGASAEEMRSTLTSANRDDLQQRYLNYYAKYYPKLKVDSPFEVKDDESLNRITLTEHYLIEGFWERGRGKGRLEANIHAPDVEDLLRAPRSAIRTAPLALAHQVLLKHTTEVLLHEPWPVKGESKRVRDAAFDFEHTITPAGSTIVFTDRFESLQDHVPAADTPRYAASLDSARGELDYVLYQDAPSGLTRSTAAGGANWSVLALGIVLFAACAYGALRLYRFDPAPAPPGDPALSGIRGWLILAALGSLAAPFRVLRSLWETVPAYSLERWALLTTPGAESFHPLWAPLLLFELSMNIALLVFSVLVVVLFFQRRRSLPTVYVGVMAVFLVLQLADLLIAGAVPAAAAAADAKAWGEFGRSVVIGIIWIAYFSMSERVRATFVNTRTRIPAAVSVGPSISEAA